jgi:hypothetical protein
VELRIETSDGLGSFRLSAEIGGLYEGYNLWLDDYQPAPPSLPSDFDLDGDVDGRDFLAWQRNPGLGDLAHWHDNYGMSGLLVGDVSAVPEPTCLAMAVAGAILVILKRYPSRAIS